MSLRVLVVAAGSGLVVVAFALDFGLVDLGVRRPLRRVRGPSPG
jgi:hypothetical protein